MKTAFSTRINALRTSIGLTQTDFANQIGTTQSALSAYERGDRTPPLDILMNIANNFGVSMDWLCGISDKETYSPKIETYSQLISLLFQLEDSNIPLYRNADSYDDSLGYRIHLFGIGFTDPIIGLFFKSWEKTHTLYAEGTIDKTIYDAWKDKIYKDFDEKFLTEKTLHDFHTTSIDWDSISEYEATLTILHEVNKPNPDASPAN